jgi:hypothetical protein
MSDKQAEVKGHEWVHCGTKGLGRCSCFYGAGVLIDRGQWQIHRAAALASQVPAQPPALCPSCNASDNTPYTDASGMAMRACGRCMIQWRDAAPVPAQGTPPVLPYEGATGHLEEHVAAPASPQVGETLEVLKWAEKVLACDCAEAIPPTQVCDKCQLLSALRAGLAESDKRARAVICPDCDGYGSIGRSSDGRLVACENCGGHEDSLGTGSVRAFIPSSELAEKWERRAKETESISVAYTYRECVIDLLAAQPTPAPKEQAGERVFQDNE